MTIKFEKQPGLLVIPRRFVKAEFDAQTNTTMGVIAKEFLKNFEKYYSAGLAPAFFGKPGIGKSHIAAVVAKQLNEQGVPVYWADVIGTLNTMMEHRDFRASTAYFDLKKKVMTIPVVVLDDFTHLQSFERTRELFFEIVNTRYANNLPTMFTANFALDPEGEKISWNDVAREFGVAITRRIKLMSKGLLFSG
jgi:DNA replication protein DnaC